jgi:hypothetical protein
MDHFQFSEADGSGLSKKTLDMESRYGQQVKIESPEG